MKSDEKARRSFSQGWIRFVLVCLTLSAPTHAQTAGEFNVRVDRLLAWSLALQTDGRIVVSDGIGTQRLNGDGTWDHTFNPAVHGTFGMMVVQGDGHILMPTSGFGLGGKRLPSIARLNSDGSLDPTFNPMVNGIVICLAAQSDGKILVGGTFTTLGDQPRMNIARFNADGTLDSTFSATAKPNVWTLAVQADGKILVIGLGGPNANTLGRLNPDGSLDTTFKTTSIQFADILTVQADGKILAWLSDQNTNYFGRLNSDGSLDTTFNPRVNGRVVSAAVQADGKILLAGDFTALGGQTRIRLGRLNADGTLDPTFLPPAYDAVNSMALQADGKILVGTQLESADGQTNSYVARLRTEPATQVLGFVDSTITWLRGGTSPEVWYTTFQYSTNDIDWIDLGTGTRISGGWRLTGVPLSPGNKVRARGYVNGGNGNSSSWFIESRAIVGAPALPVILEQPAGRTNYNATAAAFSVRAGFEPLRYQWRKNDTDLAGATNGSLLIAQVQPADAGAYSVVVTNAYGSQTSSVAMLTVRLRPQLSGLGQGLFWGQDATFGFLVSAQHCERVMIQVSRDLQHWTDIKTNNVGANAEVGFGFGDTASTQDSYRFYRLRQE